MTNETGEHPLKTIWREGGVAIGCSCKVSSSLSAEAVASRDLDYVYVDQQHGVFDNTGLLVMFQAIAAAGTVPLTRVHANRPEAIGRALDMGAMGVIIPAIENEQDAEQAVAACHYPPDGIRSHGSVRISNGRALCIALVETQAGLANVRAIAGVTGIDVVMVGAQDLALSLGIPLNGNWLANPLVENAIREILTACEEVGTISGIGAVDGTEASHWINEGFRMVNIGNDLNYLKMAFDGQIKLVRAAIEARPR